MEATLPRAFLDSGEMKDEENPAQRFSIRNSKITIFRK